MPLAGGLGLCWSLPPETPLPSAPQSDEPSQPEGACSLAQGHPAGLGAATQGPRAPGLAGGPACLFHKGVMGSVLEGCVTVPGCWVAPTPWPPFQPSDLPSLWGVTLVCPSEQHRRARRFTAPRALAQRPIASLQTFVNDVRIPDQRYVTLKLNDVIRFGYDILPGALPPPHPLRPVTLEAGGGPLVPARTPGVGGRTVSLGRGSSLTMGTSVRSPAHRCALTQA